MRIPRLTVLLLAFVLPGAGACGEVSADARVATRQAQPSWPAELPPVAIVVTDEEVVRRTGRAEAADALGDGDVEALERLSKRYRDGAERTPSGQWKLAFFYAGLVDAFEPIDAHDEAAWAAFDSVLARWQERYPASPSARLARAEALITRAWAYRGGCWAQCVDPEAWEPFRALNEQARVQLEADRDVAAVDPHWYQLMAKIALVQSWPQERYDALEAEVFAHAAGYQDAVFAAAARYRPEWGGDYEAMEAFAQRLLEHTRAQEGEALYVRLYWTVSNTDDGLRLPAGARADWATLRRSMDAVLAKYPDEWNRQHFAAMACNSQHFDDLPELMKGLEGAVLSAWGSSLNFAVCRNNAKAFASP